MAKPKIEEIEEILAEIVEDIPLCFHRRHPHHSCSTCKFQGVCGEIAVIIKIREEDDSV